MHTLSVKVILFVLAMGTRTISDELRALYKEKVSHKIQGGIGDQLFHQRRRKHIV